MRVSCIVIAIPLVLATAFGGCDGDDAVDPECGNGLLEVGEQCDGVVAEALTCANLGVGQGEVTCTDDCHLDLSGCSTPPTPPTCDNGIREAGEACDGTDVGGLTCIDLGFGTGELSCQPGCMFNLSGCGPGCQDTCTLEGASQCDASTIQTCAPDVEGCLGWEDTFDCATAQPPQACDDSGADAVCEVVCTDDCTTLGEGRCVFADTVLQTCELQPSGCLEWENTEDCTLASIAGTCDDSVAPAECKPCREDCTVLGEMTCDGNLLQTCVEVVPGCLETEVVEDCTVTEQWCGTCGPPPEEPQCRGGC